MSDGTVKAVGDEYQLRFERDLPHPVEKVWAFLTEPDKLKTWLADGEIDLRVGGRVFLEGDNIDSHVTALEPGRVLAFGWKTADWDGGIIRFELEPTSDGTRLNFTHDMSKLSDEAKRELMDKIEVPEGWDQLPSTLAGWHSIFDRLGKALDGSAQRSSLDWREAGKDALDEWRALNEHYKKVLAS
jgi:uncharacterized protein YndB with AHSA1/START domain